MPKCSRCTGTGSETYDEDGRMVTDVCYHCAGSGQVEPEVDMHDRWMQVARSIALQFENEYRTACDNDPHGDGYDLGAAENMMSVHDYFEDRVSDRQYKIAAELNQLDPTIQKILLDWHEKFNYNSEPPTVRLPSPNGAKPVSATADVASSYVVSRFNQDMAAEFQAKLAEDDDIPF